MLKENSIFSPMDTLSSSIARFVTFTLSSSVYPKSSRAAWSPLFSIVLHARFTIVSIILLFLSSSYQSEQILKTNSGWCLLISLRLFPTLRWTYWEVSSRRFWRIGRIGVGSITNFGSLVDQGSKGRQPSLESRRTCSLSSVDQRYKICIASLSYF